MPLAGVRTYRPLGLGREGRRTGSPMGSLDGYSVLVTGGGSGIGYACARRLLEDGAAVTICGRTTERLVAAAASLREMGTDEWVSPSVEWIAADVTSEPQVEEAVQRALEHGGGRLDGVVGSAGGS